MKAKLKRYKNFFINLIFPAFIFGSITGIFTAIIVTLFKLCAKYTIEFSNTGYDFLRNHLYFVPVVLAVLLGIAFLLAKIYKSNANLRGGGVPTSIAILRGSITFNWIKSLVGVFFLSLSTFLIGVPLGNEGPGVQIGTAVGRGTVYTMAKKHKAWDRYSMTGGASAGFSVATGAPISGIMFAVEEAHGRISPMIIIVASVSVMVSRITTELINLIPGLDVDIALFPNLPTIPKLEIQDIWIPIVVAVVVGIFAVLFLVYYKAVYNFFNKLLEKVPHFVKIFIIFTLTVILGLISFEFVSTGHHLIEEIFLGSGIGIGMLVLILLIRSTLTLCASSNSLTGGLFLPIMALGATLSAIIAKILISLGVSEDYYTIIVVIGITACISSMMKTPLTAIFFSIEALACHENILYVVIVATISYVITEIFAVKSINDTVLERRVHEVNGNREVEKEDTYVTVKEGSFAIGKQIRDIFWPSNLMVLSVKRDVTDEKETDKYGENVLREGDELHIRYATDDANRTREELYAIVGEQTE